MAKTLLVIILEWKMEVLDWQDSRLQLSLVTRRLGGAA